MEYKDRIRFLREYYGMGRKVFAKIIKSSAGYMEQIENGRREFKKDREKEIIDKFRLPFDFFVNPEATLGNNPLTHDEIMELLKTSIEDDDLEVIKVTYDIIEEDKK